jgi:hypothetical protein
MNYFRMRVELGHIGGKVYDLLHSTRSKKASQHERMHRVQQLDRLLEQWRRKIPASLQLESVSQTVPPTTLLHLALLYHTYLMILVMVHGIYSYDAEWVRRISSYDHEAMADCEASKTSGQNPQQALLPQGWAACVETSRSCMHLFSSMPQTDCAIW